MNRPSLNRIKRFSAGLLFFAIPAFFIFSVNILTARANLNATSTNNRPQAVSGLPDVEFTQANFPVFEGNGNVTIYVQIVPPLTGAMTATVDFATMNGTAVQPGDYTPASGTLNFDSNDSIQTFTVTIIDDVNLEPDETINLELSNPVGANLGPQDSAIITILDNEPTPTPTRTRTPTPQATSTAIFVDIFEPNNGFQFASPIQADAGTYCSLTLWPVGDEDYFRFGVKAGLAYQVTTSQLTAGLDTKLSIFNSQGTLVGTNDDYQQGNRGSQVTFSVFVNGYYYARVSNVSTEDPANKTYCIAVAEIEGTPTNTPIPTGTVVPGADNCEENGSIGTACLIGPGTTYDMNFVPLTGQGPDNDFYKMWIKTGIFYSCETLALSSVNDTNMIIYDQNGNGLAGNDDKELGDRGSKVTYLATYTGWLYVLVGPVALPDYGLSYLYTYSLLCEEDVPTPTVTPTATFIPSTGGGTGGTGGVSIPTVTPFVFPTFPATPTPFTTALPTPTPNVQVNPLPTATPLGGQTTQNININLTVYYDANNDYMPDLTEGVEGVAVAIYDNNTNELLAFGNTNEAGMIHFGPLLVTGPVRISIPYLQFNQITVGDSNILIRIAPPNAS